MLRTSCSSVAVRRARDYRSARPKRQSVIEDPVDCRAAFVPTHGPVGAYSKSTVQQTSGAVAIAQTSGVSTPAAWLLLRQKQPPSSRSRFRPLVAPLGHKQPRPVVALMPREKRKRVCVTNTEGGLML